MDRSRYCRRSVDRQWLETSASSKSKTALKAVFDLVRTVPGVGVEPTNLAVHDFKSCVYTIPPPGLGGAGGNRSQL